MKNGRIRVHSIHKPVLNSKQNKRDSDSNKEKNKEQNQFSGILTQKILDNTRSK